MFFQVKERVILYTLPVINYEVLTCNSWYGSNGTFYVHCKTQPDFPPLALRSHEMFHQIHPTIAGISAWPVPP